MTWRTKWVQRVAESGRDEAFSGEMCASAKAKSAKRCADYVLLSGRTATAEGPPWPWLPVCRSAQVQVVSILSYFVLIMHLHVDKLGPVCRSGCSLCWGPRMPAIANDNCGVRNACRAEIQKHGQVSQLTFHFASRISFRVLGHISIHGTASTRTRCRNDPRMR